MIVAYGGGDISISVIGLLMSINNVVIFPIMGVSQGMQPIVSYNYGARNLIRILRAYRYSLVVATIYVTVGMLALQLFPHQIISIFSSDDKELINLEAHSLHIFTMLFPLIGFNVITSIFFQATYRPSQAIVLSLARQLIFLLPGVAILPRFFHFDGILYSFPIADFLTALLTFILIMREMKKYKQQLRPYRKFIY
jgi:Na+-driven multidrug efflux pump